MLSLLLPHSYIDYEDVANPIKYYYDINWNYLYLGQGITNDIYMTTNQLVSDEGIITPTNNTFSALTTVSNNLLFAPLSEAQLRVPDSPYYLSVFYSAFITNYITYNYYSRTFQKLQQLVVFLASTMSLVISALSMIANQLNLLEIKAKLTSEMFNLQDIIFSRNNEKKEKTLNKQKHEKLQNDGKILVMNENLATKNLKPNDKIIQLNNYIPDFKKDELHMSDVGLQNFETNKKLISLQTQSKAIDFKVHSEKNLYTGVNDILLVLLCRKGFCKFCTNDHEKSFIDIYVIAKKYFKLKLDLTNYFKMSREIDLMKEFLFDRSENIAFDYISKIYHHDYEKIEKNILFPASEKTNYDKILKYFNNVQNKSKMSSFDEKVFKRIRKEMIK